LIFEKSGAWNGSVLGFANGLDAGKAVLDVDFAAGAAVAGAAVRAIAALASKSERIIGELLMGNRSGKWRASCSTIAGMTQA
jgi:hypothetical protein